MTLERVPAWNVGALAVAASVALAGRPPQAPASTSVAALAVVVVAPLAFVLPRWVYSFGRRPAGRVGGHRRSLQ